MLNSEFDNEYAKKRYERNLHTAREYMKAHPNETVYPVTFGRPDDDLKLTYLFKLYDDEIKHYKELELEFENPLEEYEELTNRLRASILFPIEDANNPWEVEEIKLTPEHCYLFTMVVFNDGPDNPPVSKKIHVTLSDDEYASILAWQLEKSSEGKLSFNMLRLWLPAVYERISSQLEWIYYDGVIRLSNQPYAVFMDEVEEDVAAIKALDGKGGSPEV